MKISNNAGASSSNTDLWKDITSDILGEQKQDTGSFTDTKKMTDERLIKLGEVKGAKRHDPCYILSMSLREKE